MGFCRAVFRRASKSGCAYIGKGYFVRCLFTIVTFHRNLKHESSVLGLKNEQKSFQCGCLSFERKDHLSGTGRKIPWKGTLFNPPDKGHSVSWGLGSSAKSWDSDLSSYLLTISLPACFTPSLSTLGPSSGQQLPFVRRIRAMCALSPGRDLCSHHLVCTAKIFSTCEFPFFVTPVSCEKRPLALVFSTKSCMQNMTSVSVTR